MKNEWDFFRKKVRSRFNGDLLGDTFVADVLPYLYENLLYKGTQ